jgi:hypothetical protein
VTEKAGPMLDIESLVASFEAFSRAGAQAERARLLARIRDQLEKLSAADDESRAELESFLEAAANGGADAAGAKRIMSSREKEAAAATVLIPRIQSLQRYLSDTSSPDDPEAHQLLEKAVNIVFGYVSGYQNLRDQLILFDVEQAATAEEVRRARPIEGEIDHEKLTREIIARFPKILAELAK